jgi:PHD and RING finger domain-containing protein 1
MNTCPVDRQTFDVILVRGYPNRRIIGRIPVVRRPLQIQYQEIVVQYVQFCELCGECDREDSMVSCYTCGLVYHLECLINLQEDVYLDELLCPICNPIN